MAFHYSVIIAWLIIKYFLLRKHKKYIDLEKYFMQFQNIIENWCFTCNFRENSLVIQQINIH